MCVCQILSLIVYFINIFTLLIPILIPIAFLTLVVWKSLATYNYEKDPISQDPTASYNHLLMR